MRWALTLITLVCGPAGCTPSTTGAVGPQLASRGRRDPVGTPPHGRKAGALLAVADETKVTVHRPDARTLTRLSSWSLGAFIGDLAWVDARQVAALVSGGKVALLVVGQPSVRWLQLPAAKRWRVPRPEDGDDLAESTFPLGRMRLTADAEGGLWVAHCAWHSLGDGDPCRSWLHERLLPSPQTSRHAPPARQEPEPQRTSAGLNLKVEVHNYGKSPNTLTCSWADKTQTKAFPNQPCATRLAVRWAAPHSRWLLVHVTKDCGKPTLTVERLLVHDCKLDALRPLTQLLHGPDYLWAHDAPRRESNGFAVRRRDRDLGWLRGSLLRFSAPAAE